MAATLFELVRRGRYKMTPVTREESSLLGLRHKEVDDVDLTRGDESIELSVVEQPIAAIFDKLTEEGAAVLSQVQETVKDKPTADREWFHGRSEAFESAVKNQARQRKFWSGQGMVMKWLAFVVFLLLGAGFLALGIAGLADPPLVRQDLILTAIGAALALNAVVVLVLPPSMWRRRGPKLQASAEGWEGFRRYLNDFRRLADKPADTLPLWESYLVYGIAFGIAERVLEAAKVDFPAISSSSVYAPALYVSTFNTASFASGLGGAFGSPSSGARAAVAAAGRSAAAAAAPGRPAGSRRRRADDAAVSEEHRALQAAAVEADAAAQRCLLAGDRAGAEAHLRVAEQRYRESWEAAPPGGYGRLVGMLKAAILRGDAAEAAAFALDALAFGTESPTAAYALALACLAAGDDVAGAFAAEQMAAGGEAFERTADALAALGAARRAGVCGGSARRGRRLRGARPAPHRRADRRYRPRARAARRGARPGTASVLAAPVLRFKSRATSWPRRAPAPNSPRQSSPASTSCVR